MTDDYDDNKPLDEKDPRNFHIEDYPEEEQEKELPKPDYVKMTLNSGILPLEMRFGGIYNCYSKMPKAYITYTYVNSVIEGVIPPEKYTYALDLSDRGLEVAKWNIRTAIRTLKRFKEANRNVRFITARVPAKILLVEDLYTYIKRILVQEEFNEPEKLCLEIPRTMLFEDEEKVRLSLLNLKILKVKTLMSGFGEKDSPITMLTNLPVDYVLLAPWLTSKLGDKDHNNQLQALINFARASDIEIIGFGVINDDQINILSREEAFGFVPSPRYSGSQGYVKLRMTEQEAILEEEGEDDWQNLETPSSL